MIKAVVKLQDIYADSKNNELERLSGYGKSPSITLFIRFIFQSNMPCMIPFRTRKNT